MEQYFKDNKIIPTQHHGGRKNHSTVTAMAAMDINHKEIKEKKNTVAIMTTDLSSAFDLVDHSLLLQKLNFYGLDNNACELLENFMKNRNFIHRNKASTVKLKKHTRVLSFKDPNCRVSCSRYSR